MRNNQKSLLLLFSLLLFAASLCEAKTKHLKKYKKSAFTQGQSALQPGIGFPSLIKPSTDTLLYYGKVKQTTFPPIQLRYEYAVTDNLGIGGVFGISSAKVSVTDNTDTENINGFKYSYYIAGARLAWHQNIKSKKLDPYAVGFAGFNITNASSYGPSNPLEASKKTFLWSVHAGANYYVFDKIGVFLEIGYGVAIANIGAAVKF